MSEKEVFEEFYKDAKAQEQLAWHHREPNTQLKAAVESHSEPGAALDLGCGSGNDACYVAEHGWKVTAVDFMPQAVTMTLETAAEKNVSVHTVEADVLEWETDEQFDLVLDSGLMHNMDRAKIAKYKKRILDWLKPDGDFVIAHWESRSDLDRLNGGPRRASKEQIESFFAPELTHVKGFSRKEAQICNDCQGQRCEQKNKDCSQVGPKISIAHFWFKRT